MSGTSLAAIITGLAAIITGIGGVLLAIRSVRDKERKAAKKELDHVEGMLTEEREKRIEAEKRVYSLRLSLAQHGIENGIPHDEPD